MGLCHGRVGLAPGANLQRMLLQSHSGFIPSGVCFWYSLTEFSKVFYQRKIQCNAGAYVTDFTSDQSIDDLTTHSRLLHKRCSASELL
ncbi:hypothetical protein HUJ04_012671 [Dendroctonus ponderosae]|nr:hypothetical protein HUJ04_012671 [Dendroctonus ponderosae]